MINLSILTGTFYVMWYTLPNQSSLNITYLYQMLTACIAHACLACEPQHVQQLCLNIIAIDGYLKLEAKIILWVYIFMAYLP